MVSPTSRNQIKRLANEIRTTLGLYDEVFFPVLDVLEHALPMLDPTFTCEIVPDVEMGYDQANYNPVTNTMKIRESVYLGAYGNNGRDRFTIAHELGHYFMHDTITLSRVEPGVKIPAYKNPEWQANTFAAAILMPDHIIAGLGPDRISKQCGTSYDAANIAYVQLQKIKTTKSELSR